MSDPVGYTLSPEERLQQANPNHEPDILGEHVADGVRVLHMTEADKAEAAAQLDMTWSDYEALWQRVAKTWTEHLDRNQLTPEQYRALFDEDKPGR